jgi:hypothetical protein
LEIEYDIQLLLAFFRMNSYWNHMGSFFVGSKTDFLNNPNSFASNNYGKPC